MRDLISAAGPDVAERARRERLLRHLESADKAHPLELAKYGLERIGVFFGDGHQTLTLAVAELSGRRFCIDEFWV